MENYITSWCVSNFWQRSENKVHVKQGTENRWYQTIWVRCFPCVCRPLLPIHHKLWRDFEICGKKRLASIAPTSPSWSRLKEKDTTWKTWRYLAQQMTRFLGKIINLSKSRTIAIHSCGLLSLRICWLQIDFFSQSQWQDSTPTPVWTRLPLEISTWQLEILTWSHPHPIMQSCIIYHHNHRRQFQTISNHITLWRHQKLHHIKQLAPRQKPRHNNDGSDTDTNTAAKKSPLASFTWLPQVLAKNPHGHWRVQNESLKCSYRTRRFHSSDVHNLFKFSVSQWCGLLTPSLLITDSRFSECYVQANLDKVFRWAYRF